MNCPHCGHTIKPKLGLTPRQAEALDFIRQYRALNSLSPSYADIAKALKLGSTNGIHRMVLGLEERGHIRRLPGHARSIEVIEEQAHA